MLSVSTLTLYFGLTINLYSDFSIGESKYYYSSNSVDRSEIHDNGIMKVLTPKFLSSLRTSGLPNHIITLKIGTPIMPMRNTNQSEGLCNGTWLIVIKMANHVLEAEIMGGKGRGKVTYIPRMDMSPSQCHLGLSN